MRTKANKTLLFNTSGVMVNILNCNVVVSEFEPRSHFYFWINVLFERYKFAYIFSYGLTNTTVILLQMWLIDTSLYNEIKQSQNLIQKHIETLKEESNEKNTKKNEWKKLENRIDKMLRRKKEKKWWNRRKKQR